MNYKKYLTFYTEALPKRWRLPTGREKSIFDINFDNLKSEIDLVIFDFDDTLSDFHGGINSSSEKLLNKLQKLKFNIAVLSNCSEERADFLDKLLAKWNILSVRGSNKPSEGGFLQAMQHYNVASDRTMAVGDKLGTDIYGAYLAKIKYRIIVEPYSKLFGGKKAELYNRVVRKFEKFLYFRLFKNEKV